MVVICGNQCLTKNCYNLFFFNVLACWHLFPSFPGYSRFHDSFPRLILVDDCVILRLLLADLSINQPKLDYLGIHYIRCNREHDSTTAAALKVIVCDNARYLITEIKRV